MAILNRRQFLAASALAPLAQAGSKTRVGFLHSTHSRLARPSSPEDLLDYERVRDMVWKAIEYGAPRAGSLEKKIPRGAWVVVKPNIVFLRPQDGYRIGDITDMRVTKAVLEYVARKSGAARITVAEGGSYRSLRDPAKDNVVSQGGVRVNAASFDWGGDEFPGWGGSLGGMLKEFAAQFPGKKFDYVDLSYDALRDPAGRYQRIEVPRSRNGVGAFAPRADYFYSKTVRACDFLINVPVMKIHDQCGITACMKSYVGVAPREAYADPGAFHNKLLHREHSLEDRIDSFLCDLAALRPADYCVVDGLRGLQYQEHNIRRPDQMIQSNLVMAGEDLVANDAVVARVMGFNVWDMEFLQMAAQRDMGVMDLGKIEVVGDEPDRFQRRWGKPRNWYGRCNREWLLSADPAAAMASWKRQVIPTDTLKLPAQGGAAAVKVRAGGTTKVFLWVGVRGRVTALLNGETVMAEENRTRYRIGQFQKPVELRSGENLLVLRVEALTSDPQVSALLVGPRNDGDTVDGIQWVG